MPEKKNPSLKDPELYEELRDKAKEIGLSGYSRQRKQELIDSLRNS